MIVWLWEAGDPGRFHGVTDDETRARTAAETCIRDGHATTARVQQARLRIGGFWVTSHYQPTGDGWSARKASNGITWVAVTTTAT